MATSESGIKQLQLIRYIYGEDRSLLKKTLLLSSRKYPTLHTLSTVLGRKSKNSRLLAGL